MADIGLVKWSKIAVAGLTLITIAMVAARFMVRVEAAIEPNEALIAEVRGHHDTLQTLEAFDIDLHMIQQTLDVVIENQEEYNDSALVQRQRRFCRENPEEC